MVPRSSGPSIVRIEQCRFPAIYNSACGIARHRWDYRNQCGSCAVFVGRRMYAGSTEGPLLYRTFNITGP